MNLIFSIVNNADAVLSLSIRDLQDTERYRYWHYEAKNRHVFCVLN